MPQELSETVTVPPTHSLCTQLLRLHAALSQHLSAAAAATCIAGYPLLLNASPDILAWHVEELFELFGQRAATHMLARLGGPGVCVCERVDV